MNNVETIRIIFSKKSTAKYISHLDLMRTMTRVLRRAQIPIWYTEGFSKHPYITFAAPLSLGYEGERESMDFRLESPMDMTEIVDRLNENVPKGIAVLSAAPAVMKAGTITASRWKLLLPQGDRSKFEELLSRETIEVQKQTKKKVLKTIDIKPLITDVNFEETAEGDIVYLTLPTGEQSVNPGLLLRAVYGDDETDVSVTRLMVLSGEKEFL